MKKYVFIIISALFIFNCNDPEKNDQDPENTVSQNEDSTSDQTDQNEDDNDDEANSEEDSNEQSPSYSYDKINISFECGSALSSGYKNIYVIWMENEYSNFLQNIYICEKLIKGGLTGTALPYWKVNIYPDSESDEIDAVTSATIAMEDFSVSADLKTDTLTNLTVYFETDRSYDANDWFTDQPAVLYAVDVDLSDSSASYEMSPVGWTPNENTEGVISGTSMGILENELRYITHSKENDTFGEANDTESSLNIVKNITVTIE